MDLILWRHAEAELLQEGQDDLQRCLTSKGDGGLSVGEMRLNQNKVAPQSPELAALSPEEVASLLGPGDRTAGVGNCRGGSCGPVEGLCQLRRRPPGSSECLDPGVGLGQGVIGQSRAEQKLASVDGQVRPHHLDPVVALSGLSKERQRGRKVSPCCSGDTSVVAGGRVLELLAGILEEILRSCEVAGCALDRTQHQQHLPSASQGPCLPDPVVITAQER